MKVLFMGTPEFALPTLKAIFESENHTLLGVVTQPDRKGSRGKKIIVSPVKQYAIDNGILVHQFEKINNEVELLKSLGADIAVTVAYGQILSNAVLTAFPKGIINVHASILPKYRGASPVQCALLNGEKELGVTIMQTVKEVDAGDIWAIKSFEPEQHSDAEECLSSLAELGGNIILEVLDTIEKGEKTPVPQNHNKATFCKKIEKADGLISFEEDSQTIINKIRAYTPWPSVYFNSKYGRIKIIRAKRIPENANKEPGVIINAIKTLIVSCGKGAIELLQIQGENAKPMNVYEFLLGKPFVQGENICL